MRTPLPTAPDNEGRWTLPRPDCPRPGYWTSTDAHSTEIEVSELVGAFVRALQPEYVVETGTCWGQTAEAIGKALQANGHGQLVTLEVQPEKVGHSAARCLGLPVDVRQQSSLDFTPEREIDFAFFDSLLDLRMPEVERYRPFFTHRTVIGIHDTGPQFGSFGGQVAGMFDGRVLQLPTPRGVTFIRV